MSSILIKNSIIFTMKGDGLGVIEDGGIYIEDDEIVEVGSTSKIIKTGYKGDHVIDGNYDKVVLPGFIDCHMHTYLSLIKGLAQDVPEIEWMHKTIFPFMPHIKEKHLIAGARLSILEGIKYGTTTFGDYGYPMKPLLQKVYIPLGLRAVATPTINAISESREIKPDSLYLFDEEKAYKRLEENMTLIEKYHESYNGRVHIMFGPQAVDMIPLDILKEIFEISKELDILVHMHVAQGGREHKQMMMRYGKPTIALLNKEGLLNRNLVAVHCHYATEEELKLMAKMRVKMVSCPSSIAIIDGIVPPLAKYLQYNGIAGLGSDQAAGNNNQSILSELKIGALLNKTKERDPTVLPAWKMLRIATIEGAKIMGIDDHVGSIESGKKADLIIFDLKNPTLTPRILYPIRNIAHNIVYAARGDEIEYVIVDGNILKENYQLTFINERKVLEDVQKIAIELAKEGGEDYLTSRSLLVREFEQEFF